MAPAFPSNKAGGQSHHPQPQLLQPQPLQPQLSRSRALAPPSAIFSSLKPIFCALHPPHSLWKNSPQQRWPTESCHQRWMKTRSLKVHQKRPKTPKAQSAASRAVKVCQSTQPPSKSSLSSRSSTSTAVSAQSPPWLCSGPITASSQSRFGFHRTNSPKHHEMLTTYLFRPTVMGPPPAPHKPDWLSSWIQYVLPRPILLSPPQLGSQNHYCINTMK